MQPSTYSSKFSFQKLSGSAFLSSWRSSVLPSFTLLFVLIGTLIVYFLLTNNIGSESIQRLPIIIPSSASRYHENHIFPHIAHQMWKTKDSLTPDFIRWREGCQQLNTNYTFPLYDDYDLKLFTHQHYPEYSELFDSLKGVYMADMARVLVIYHFGGLYIDLDFYCHRSLECLENYAFHQIVDHLAPSMSISRARREEIQRQILDKSSSILILSREPDLHSRYIHNIPRVVIQDFFLSTPQHPFFKWFLDSANKLFHESKEKNIATQRGPFSYSIQHALDEYYKEFHHVIFQQSHSSLATRTISESTGNHTKEVKQRKIAKTEDTPELIKSRHRHHRWLGRRLQEAPPVNDTSNANTTEPTESVDHPITPLLPSTTTLPREYILEMRSEIVHPLIDSTNKRISEGCASKENNQKYNLAKECQAFSKGKYLFSSENTTLVHMWTHSFLSFSFLRGWYEHGNYMDVEKHLPPTLHCPVPAIH